MTKEPIVGKSADEVAKQAQRMGITELDPLVRTPKRIDLDAIDFNGLLRRELGPPPKDMIGPHAHHILFKKGNGAAQQTLVEEGQAILRKHGIDPIFGTENLVWAPGRVEGQHDIAALQNVVDTLKQVDAAGGGYEEIVEALKELGRVAAQRTK